MKNPHLRELSEMSTKERSFLSVYLSKETLLKNVEKRYDALRAVLKSDPDNRDELEYFNENVRAVMSYLDEHGVKSDGLCLFSNWVLDMFKAVEVAHPMKDVVWIDSSPYIRPLAEFEDEFESYAVVLTDNDRTRIYYVAANKMQSEESVKGDIKNHVKVGGWSQQRYERRRDKQLSDYAGEIIDTLNEMRKEEDFQRIILVGGKEIIRILLEDIPDHLKDKIVHKAVDLNKDEEHINEDIWELFQEMERTSERDLWEKIREEYMRGGRAVVGLDDVFLKAKEYRIDSLIVDRDLKIKAKRCRDCGKLQRHDGETCTSCGSESLYDVDYVNEIVELVLQSGGKVIFSDPIPELDKAGKIAAYLRY